MRLSRGSVRTPLALSRRAPEPTGPVGWVWRFFARTAWTREHATAGGLRGAAWRAVRVSYLAVSGFLRDDCPSRAAALTYVTVLSLVPMLALSFAVAKGFGFYDSLLRETISPALDETFGALDRSSSFVLAPESYVVQEQSHAVRLALETVLQFVQRTDVSALGWMGLAVLVFTVLKLLGSIEGTFNHIWGVARARSWVRKLTDYLALLVVAPLFLFVATGVTTAARSSSLFQWISGQEHVRGVLDLGLKLGPLLVLWAGFTFVYVALPNARTRFSSALLGAVVGGTLWQVVLLVHLEFQVSIARYNAIYSGFAALPVFLMWIHFSWLSVLVGAEVCNAHQSEPSCSQPSETNEEDQAFRELLALRCLGRIGEAFLGGTAPWTVDRLAQDLALPRRPVAELLAELCDCNLVCEVLQEGEPTYVPARTLESITIHEVLTRLRGRNGFEGTVSTAAVDEALDAALGGLAREAADSRHNRTLHSLAQAALRARAAAEPGPAAAGGTSLAGAPST